MSCRLVPHVPALAASVRRVAVVLRSMRPLQQGPRDDLAAVLDNVADELRAAPIVRSAPRAVSFDEEERTL